MKTNLLLGKSALFLFILCAAFAFSSCEELPFDESENTEQTDDGDASDGGPQDNPGSAGEGEDDTDLPDGGGESTEPGTGDLVPTIRKVKSITTIVHDANDLGEESCTFSDTFTYDEESRLVRWEALELEDDNNNNGYAVEVDHNESVLNLYWLDDSGWEKYPEYRVCLDKNGRLDKLSSTDCEWTVKYTDSGYLSSFEMDGEVHDHWEYVGDVLQKYSYLSDPPSLDYIGSYYREVNVSHWCEERINVPQMSVDLPLWMIARLLYDEKAFLIFYGACRPVGKYLFDYWGNELNELYRFVNVNVRGEDFIHIDIPSAVENVDYYEEYDTYSREYATSGNKIKYEFDSSGYPMGFMINVPYKLIKTHVVYRATSEVVNPRQVELGFPPLYRVVSEESEVETIYEMTLKAAIDYL